jgi:hypothetical protein
MRSYTGKGSTCRDREYANSIQKMIEEAAAGNRSPIQTSTRHGNNGECVPPCLHIGSPPEEDT